MIGTAIDQDVAGKLRVVGSQFMKRPGSKSGVRDGRRLKVARAGKIVASIVDALSGCHGTHEADVMHLLRQFRKPGADLNGVGAGVDGFHAAHFRSARFGIESIDVTQATSQVEVDDILRFQ